MSVEQAAKKFAEKRERQKQRERTHTKGEQTKQSGEKQRRKVCAKSVTNTQNSARTAIRRFDVLQGGETRELSSASALVN